MQRLTLGYRYKTETPRPDGAKSSTRQTRPPSVGAPDENAGQKQSVKQKQSGIMPFSLSPDTPLFSLGKRKIYPDDLLLFVLLLTLMQDKADPSVLAAIVYLLASE